jgi:hypothetical protein
MLVTDRDLLALEPNLFRDAGWAGQRVVSGVGSISGTTLTLSSSDVSLIDAGVGPGHVVSVDGTSYEVIAVLSATTATISRLRAGAGDPVLVPSPASSKPVSIVTLRAQTALVERQVLRMAGIEPGAAAGPGVLTEANLVSPGELRWVTALGTLHLVFTGVAALSAPGSPAWLRAELYRRRFIEERQRASASVDTDGDGVADAVRRLNVLQLVRA